MIVSTAFNYTPFTLASGIPESLDVINGAFVGIITELKASLTALTGGAVSVFGLNVTSGVYPALAVDVGYVLDSLGVVHTYAAGSLTVSGTAAAVSYVWVASDYTLNAGAVVPGGAIAVLATVTNNGGGTAFTSINQGMLSETYTVDGSDNLTAIAYTSGSIVLKSTVYTLDGSGNPTSITETLGANARVKTITYTNGMPTLTSATNY